jgi:hypothetical protein
MLLFAYFACCLVYSPSSALAGGGEVSEVLTEVPDTRYSSLVHLSKSISLQRSEQKGRHGLSCHSTRFPQVGHLAMLQN